MDKINSAVYQKLEGLRLAAEKKHFRYGLFLVLSTKPHRHGRSGFCSRRSLSLKEQESKGLHCSDMWVPLSHTHLNCGIPRGLLEGAHFSVTFWAKLLTTNLVNTKRNVSFHLWRMKQCNTNLKGPDAWYILTWLRTRHAVIKRWHADLQLQWVPLAWY